jgi:surfeit locus 1 family protein
MYRFLLRPRWLAFHLLVLVGVTAMVGAGFWQLDRYNDRRALNQEITERASFPVVELDEVLRDGVDPASVEWRTVRVTGEFLGDEQVLVVNRTQGGVAGRNVVTPLLLDDSRAIFVTRGFISLTDDVPGPSAGTVTVVGRLRETQRRGLTGLTDPPGERIEFQRLDIPRIAEQLDVPVLPMSLDLLTAEPAVDLAAGDPLPLPDPELSDGPHLSYMIQWWIFSICAIAGWVFAVRRSARTRQRTVSAAGERTAADSPPQGDDEPTTAPSRTPTTSRD